MYRLLLVLCYLSISTLDLHAEVYRVTARDKVMSEAGKPYLDQPFNPAYIDSLKLCGVKILGTSKWLNLAYVEADKNILPKLKALSFVIGVELVNSAVKVSSELSWLQQYQMSQSNVHISYGQAGPQLEMHRLNFLHARGFTGKGVRIALFDGGFYKVDSLQFFNKLFKQGQIIATRDFHDSNNNVYDDNWHGMSVLSTISADSPGVFMGAAYDASFLLARTEVTFFEKHIEELYYLKAMEGADAIGVDIIHASLGYVVFDSAEGDYQYPHMDGNSTIITRAADIAASKGILVTNSAGNLGAHPYGKITAPCDGDSVLCVGAVDMNGFIAPFSSRGPSADGRVKPDVVATGLGTIVVAENDSLRSAGGTSFSGPIIAGLAACLKQAHPLRSNMEIIQAIRQSSDRYQQPNETHGYGIPDAMKAHAILKSIDNDNKLEISIWPNPAQGFTQLFIPWSASELSVKIFDSSLQTYLEYKIPSWNTERSISIEGLSPGLYNVWVSDGTQVAVARFLLID